MTQVDAANPLKVGIVGGTGYTGVELLRLLVRHPLVRLETITSRSEQGLKVSDLYPTLRGYTDLKFEEPDVAALKVADLKVALRQEIGQGLVAVDRQEDKVIITVGAGGAFPSGSAELTEAALSARIRVERAAIRGRRQAKYGHTSNST